MVIKKKVKYIISIVMICGLLLPIIVEGATKTNEGKVTADIEFFNSTVGSSTQTSSKKEQTSESSKKKSGGLLPKTGESVNTYSVVFGGAIVTVIIGLIFFKKKKVGERVE